MANRVVKLSEFKHYNEESYAYPMSLSKVVEVDKTKSISEMTFDELRMLINRLRDEREAEDVIRSLRRSAGLKDTFENPAKIDTTTPVEQLYHEEVEHSGVKDMKWGIRRYQNKDGTRTTLGKAREESEDYTRTRENSRKGSESLSNEELKKLNERLKLEADYRSLTTAKIEKAESFVGDALKKAASSALTSFASSIMLGAAKSLVKEISPSLAEAAGFGVKAAVAATQAQAQAQAQAQTQAPAAPKAQAPAAQNPTAPKLTKSQRKAARNNKS